MSLEKFCLKISQSSKSIKILLMRIEFSIRKKLREREKIERERKLKERENGVKEGKGKLRERENWVKAGKGKLRERERDYWVRKWIDRKCY